MKNLCGELSDEEKQNLSDYLKIYIGKIYIALGTANEVLKSEAINKEFIAIFNIMGFIKCYFTIRKDGNRK